MNCLICRETVKKPLTINCSKYPGILDKWQVLSLEAFCVLFGLSREHPLIAVLFPDGKFVQKLCPRCLEDVGNVHYVIWQLSSLERKLEGLQNLLFDRLRVNYEAIDEGNNAVEGGEWTNNDLEYDNVVKSLFEEIKLAKDLWPRPRSVFGCKWIEAQHFAKVFKTEAVVQTKEVEATILTPNDGDEEYQMTLEEPLEEPFNEEEPVDYLVDDVDDVEYQDDQEDSDWEYNSDAERKSKRNSQSKKARLKGKKKGKLKKYIGGLSKSGGFLCVTDPDICTRTYHTQKDLNKHIRQFHRDRKYLCDFEGCVQKFLSEISLNQHRARDHGLKKEQEFRCTMEPETCNQVYSEKKELSKHIKEVHTEKIYACDVEGCNQSFITEGHLKSHKVHIHERKKESIQICEICGASVRSRKMKYHYRLHHLGKEKFNCDRCSMNFSKSDELVNHEKLHDSFSETFPFTCVITPCNKVFSNSVDLKGHVVTDHLTGWVKCETCGIVKPNEFLLKIHQKVHEGRKVVFCDQCPRAFSTENSLRCHKRSYHMGLQYTCEICGKVITRKASFDRHMRCHLGVKPHKCGVCPKAFVTVGGLKRHEAIHSGTKRFKCELCGKRFKQSDNLRQHLRTQAHKGQQPSLKIFQMVVGPNMEDHVNQ